MPLIRRNQVCEAAVRGIGDCVEYRASNVCGLARDPEDGCYLRSENYCGESGLSLVHYGVTHPTDRCHGRYCGHLPENGSLKTQPDASILLLELPNKDHTRAYCYDGTRNQAARNGPESGPDDE